MSSAFQQASQQVYQVSSSELDVLINEKARFKQRSHNTHTQTHQLQLESTSALFPQVSPQIDIVLLGDSMLERFKTSGKYTQIGQLPYPQLFNAGVGGDKIENVLYRVNLGLIQMLKPGNPKVIVLQLGTNNLQRTRGLEGQHLDEYYILVQALLIYLPIRPQVLVTGLFKRNDVDEECITQSNTALKELVDRINVEEIAKHVPLQDHCIHWIDPPTEFEETKHLDDNVHLNISGYQMWNAILYPKIQELLSRANAQM